MPVELQASEIRVLVNKQKSLEGLARELESLDGRLARLLNHLSSPSLIKLLGSDGDEAISLVNTLGESRGKAQRLREILPDHSVGIREASAILGENPNGDEDEQLDKIEMLDEVLWPEFNQEEVDYLWGLWTQIDQYDRQALLNLSPTSDLIIARNLGIRPGQESTRLAKGLYNAFSQKQVKLTFEAY